MCGCEEESGDKSTADKQDIDLPDIIIGTQPLSINILKNTYDFDIKMFIMYLEK